MPGVEEGNAASSATAAETEKSCAECGTIGPDLKRCMACKSVFYCGTACQRTNRKAHKKECKARAFELDVELFKSKRPECPICMYILPVTGKGCTYMACCGKTTCNACKIEHSLAFASAAQPCPFCRASAPVGNKEENAQYLARMEIGDATAILHMACDCMEGVGGIEKDEKKGTELLQRAADLGNAEACSKLGQMYLRGLFVQQDYVKAEKLLTQSTKAGSASGAFALSRFFITVRINMASSTHNLRLSAAMGYEPAMSTLTELYTKVDPHRTYLKKEEFEASLRSFQVAQDEMKSEAREKWAKDIESVNKRKNT